MLYNIQVQSFHLVFDMCFIKHVAPIDYRSGESSSSLKLHKQDSFSETGLENDFLFIPHNKEYLQPKLDSGLVLLNCLNLMKFNSQMMESLDLKLEQAHQMITESNDLVLEQKEAMDLACATSRAGFIRNLPEKDELFLFETVDPLAKKLFGNTHYKYKLQVNGEFSQVLYKERNFGCSLKLVDPITGQQLHNGNMLNLCFGLCDADGEWIHQTKEGMTFLKGKIETELIHGSAEFIKLAPRDVSRGFSNRMVNIVIYTKPSLLQYSGESSLEQHIRSEEIAPLIIHDVSIKAKKRE